jgi:hypothetical protein
VHLAVERDRDRVSLIQAHFGWLDKSRGEIARLGWDDVALPANGFLDDPFNIVRVLTCYLSPWPTTKIGDDSRGSGNHRGQHRQAVRLVPERCSDAGKRWARRPPGSPW